MTLTSQQLALRRQSIGASDVPAILGLCPWPNANARSVQASKLYDLDETTNPAMEFGNLMERPLCERVRQRLGIDGDVTPTLIQHPDDPHLTANLDDLLDPTQATEAKYSGVDDEWGEPGTPEVPERVVAQTAYQLALMPTLERIHIPAVVMRHRRPTVNDYLVLRDDELGAMMVRAARLFWARFVDARDEITAASYAAYWTDVFGSAEGMPDPGAAAAPSLDTYRRIRRVEGESADIDAALVERWQARRDERLAMEKGLKREEEEAQAAVLAAMGEAQIGCCQLGEVRVTKSHIKEAKPREYDRMTVSFRKAK